MAPSPMNFLRLQCFYLNIILLLLQIKFNQASTLATTDVLSTKRISSFQLLQETSLVAESNITTENIGKLSSSLEKNSLCSNYCQNILKAHLKASIDVKRDLESLPTVNASISYGNNEYVTPEVFFRKQDVKECQESKNSSTTTPIGCARKKAVWIFTFIVQRSACLKLCTDSKLSAASSPLTDLIDSHPIPSTLTTTTTTKSTTPSTVSLLETKNVTDDSTAKKAVNITAICGASAGLAAIAAYVLRNFLTSSGSSFETNAEPVQVDTGDALGDSNLLSRDLFQTVDIDMFT